MMRILFYPLCAANEPYLFYQFLSRNKNLNNNNNNNNKIAVWNLTQHKFELRFEYSIKNVSINFYLMSVAYCTEEEDNKTATLTLTR